MKIITFLSTGFLTALIVVNLADTPARAAEAPVQLTVSAGRPGAKINPAMWGIFFEDINLGADGGLYAELVKNRSFEFPDPMMGWSQPSSQAANGAVEIRTDAPFDANNPHYLRVNVKPGAANEVANEGFRGMGFHEGATYNFSVQARSQGGAPATLRVDLMSANNRVLGSAKLSGFTGQWQKYTATLKAAETEAKGHLNLVVEGGTALDLDMVSLFPADTWKNRPGGLRADMVQMLADLHPGFLRFPGGCIVEGSQLDRRYQWKTTIGPVEDRKLIINRWNYEFKHRPTPDYFQSFGLGFFEFFQVCEDIGASPLPIINCGMACQFNTAQLVPLDQLDPYIQDALDLIEFANGPANSEWGAKRAAMGHSQPFNLKMMGVGNEQWGQQYLDRYVKFAKVLKQKHPEITLISDAGPAPSDDRFNFLWPRLVKMDQGLVDIVDQHCYARPIWFLNNAGRYDNYDRKGPKVFMGEYAAQSDKIVSIDNRNNWECALSEAAYMTGLERNAEVVRIASYAPLFGHVDGWQWTPNLIWADNLRTYGTPNYYVQQLYSRNRGDEVLPVRLDIGSQPTPRAEGGIVLSTFHTSAEFRDVRVMEDGKTLLASDFSKNVDGWTPKDGKWAAKDGAYQQLDDKAVATAVAGDASWKDYTLTLRARKLGGEEGFIIGVRNLESGTVVQWNLGGWGNTQHGVQSFLGVQDSLVAHAPGKIEAGRWYEIKIVVNGPRLKFYLNGSLVHQVEVPVPHRGGFFASAVQDDQAGEVILKLANADASARDAVIHLNGVKNVRPGAKAFLLTGGKLDDVNSFEEPKNVSPRETAVEINSRDFKQNVPANAFMVLRVPVER